MIFTGRGVENVNSWLAIKRYLYKTNHPLYSNGFPNSNNGHLAMPIHANVGGNLNKTMNYNIDAVLPPNIIGDNCDTGEEFCGYWWSNGWNDNNLNSLPDPEDWTLSYSIDYFACIFR